MKLSYFSLLLALPLAISAMDERAPTMSSYFKLGIDAFDEDLETWHKGIFTNLVATADRLKHNSDFAQLCRAMKDKTLTQRAQDEPVLEKAKDNSKKIENNKKVNKAFQEAHKAFKTDEDKTKRAKKWTAFRKVAAEKINAFEKEAIPDIQHPYGGPNALADWLTKNKDLKLTEEQEKAYLACQVVLFSFRQIHRNVDKATDDPNLLLDKKVTEPQQ